ncbi:pyroglutamyl-peptidase I [Zafaria sp. Z1313]|uniref:pyroglutamyl-peptidase I n=1 Tax=unclassified Zafaria TaxID=2828765 RepID=UPI002E7627CD|nr:pyroglutamyl-peptidase I [Zafaria sp. J156]MEE1621996.1 pyroglutamyl-peptidase I [Zafaria sp. J156]
MILLTGFEPFDGAAENPSILAARAAAGVLRAAGHDAEAVELPCVFSRSGQRLEEALERFRPDVVLCTGLAAGRGAVSLERAALNVIDARIPDNEGARPVDVPVVDGGPAAYFTRLPLKRTLAALRAAGIPAEVSQTAGTYVCNQVFYHLMHALESRTAAGDGPPAGGFVHVPAVDAADGGTGITVPLLARALEIAALEALSGAPDVALAAGAEH